MTNGDLTQGSQHHEAPLLSVRDVTFSYQGDDRPVLSGISFELPRRGITALVGTSGAGKTSVLRLIERFEAPDSGEILLDGIDTSTIPLGTLRARVGLVEQEPFLFERTLRDNILFAEPEASDEQLNQAIERAQLTDVVAKAAQGLDTKVGDDGVRLSGGERQRVALARILLMEPDLLLLDEVTSQLDPLAESALHKAIQDIQQDCSVLLISHRMSSIRQAARILLISQGNILNEGTHESLLKKEPHYRALMAEQDSPAADAPHQDPSEPLAAPGPATAGGAS